MRDPQRLFSAEIKFLRRLKEPNPQIKCKIRLKYSLIYIPSLTEHRKVRNNEYSIFSELTTTGQTQILNQVFKYRPPLEEGSGETKEVGTDFTPTP